MLKTKRGRAASTAGLLLLALVTGGLWAAAFLRVGAPVSEAVSVPTASRHAPQTSPSASIHEPSSKPSPTPSSGSTPSASPSAATDLVVAVIGDRYSAQDGITWVSVADEVLGWRSVANFAAAGKGFVAQAYACEGDTCGSFTDSLRPLTETKPDMVVVFGGTADGDRDISEDAAGYFAELRHALPEARIVALSPVTGADIAPVWLGEHARDIKAAVTAVGGTFIDVGQPALGDGRDLSKESQAEIAKIVIKELE